MSKGKTLTRRRFIAGAGAVGLGGILLYRHAPSILSGRGDRPNIVLVTMDTQRRQRLGCYGYERDTSPFVDSIAKEGTVFDSAYSQACFTLLSIGSKMTSRYPRNQMPLGIYWSGFYDEKDFQNTARIQSYSRLTEALVKYTSSSKPYAVEDWLKGYDPMHNVLEEHRGGTTLAEKLRKEGYQTFGAVSMSQLKVSKGFGRGFDSYSIDEKFRSKTAGKRNGDKTAEVCKHMLSDSKRSKPFFLWFHIFDAHPPLTAPAEFKTMFSTEGDFEHEKGTFIGFDPSRVKAYNTASYRMTKREAVHYSDLYDGQVRFGDANIRNLVEFMRKQDYFRPERDVLVLSADHGEDIMTHGFCGYHCTLYNTVTNVPLIFYGAGIPRGQRIDALVANLDIAPTLMDMIGANIPANWEGRSITKMLNGNLKSVHSHLFTDNEDLTRTSVKVAGKSLIYDFNNGHIEVYDLAKDPGELENLGDDKTLVKLALDYGKDEIAQRKRNGDLTNNLTEEEKEELRSMGYINF